MGRLLDLIRPLPVRGKRRLLDRFVPHDGLVHATVFGASVQLDLSDWIQRGVYLGSYELEETRLVSRWLTRGMTVVDVGANIGYYTLLAADCVGPLGRVLAIEPSREAAARLRATIAENGLRQVTVMECAIGARPETATLYVSPRASGCHTPTMVEPAPESQRESVVVRTLDDVLDASDVGRIDLLKIDVEGYEPFVLAGAGQSLAAGRVRAVLCEMNAAWLARVSSSPEVLTETIRRSGFELLRATRENAFFVLRENPSGFRASRTRPPKPKRSV